jgi:Tfp pilus assembly protein PilE
MKSQRGIALVALILVIIVIGIVVFIGFKYANNYIENEEKEDIKTTMLTIQGKITNIQNKHIVDESNSLKGTKIDLENNQTEYNINEELKKSLLTIENPELYILNEDELNELGVKDIVINDTEFYVVEYNTKEVFYSLGVNGKYKLSEM